MVHVFFAGTECQKRGHLEECLSSCNAREALEMERREFERMSGQRGEVLSGGCVSEGGGHVVVW